MVDSFISWFLNTFEPFYIKTYTKKFSLKVSLEFGICVSFNCGSGHEWWTSFI